MKNLFFQLPFSFDKALLKQDLLHCVGYEWSRHFNQKDFTGEWTGISLRSCSGNVSDINASSNTEGYQDTTLLQECVYFQSVIKQFECEKETIRLLSLNPNSLIKEHRDRGLSYANGVFRLHVPITTDEDVDFVVAENRLVMNEGECWYANFDAPHSVAHRGTQARVHLVIDCKRNAWSDALFAQVGYDFVYEKQNQQPSIEEKQQTIKNLKLMNTDTARQFIKQLETEIAFDKSVKFIQSIGIPVHFKNIETACFLPGILIENGEIIVDRDKISYLGDILHEAGHIAVVPATERVNLNAQTLMERNDRHAEEMMAIAWSYAACRHLGIDVSFVFHDEGYKGGGSSLAESFNNGQYFGVPMLQWVGMTREGKKNLTENETVYPYMLHWLRA